MAMPVELVTLIQRFNQLGRLLPRPVEDIELEDLRTRAEVEVILDEMNLVKAQIDTFLTQRGLSPWFDSATRNSPR
jgi:hypothetical protein